MVSLFKNLDSTVTKNRYSDKSLRENIKIIPKVFHD